MAVAQAVLSETRRGVLEALCDTFIPAVEADAGDPVEREFMARAASDLQVAAQIEDLLAQAMLPEEIEALGGLLDALGAEGFAEAPLEARTAIVHAFRDQDPDAKHGLHQVKALTYLFFYALPDEAGSNPNWEALGYPGPASAPPSPEAAPKTIAVEQVSGDSATLECDVCVVGSGAGGAVIAARLRRGRQARARCSRPAATGTRPTSSSSSCPATSSSTTAAGWRRPNPARSRSSPARRSAAARSSTT